MISLRKRPTLNFRRTVDYSIHGMSKKRLQELRGSRNEPLTEQEARDGWFFCCNFRDGPVHIDDVLFKCICHIPTEVLEEKEKSDIARMDREQKKLGKMG